ncbi:MAG: inositol monophosphatase [Planctomycetes bacterium]|nr:inositol monophosphatase [Planctomycetota bacterium]
MIKAATEAGKMLVKKYREFDRSTVRLKAHHEILTKADLLSEELIIKEIRRNFPSHGILSEERGEIKSDSPYFWFVDPIDGTANFSMHNPLWAVSIGVSYENEIVGGVIFAPILNEIFIGGKNQGASLNGRAIKVSPLKESKVLNTYCHGRDPKHVRQAVKYYAAQKLKELDCRQLGSASIELAYVAAGRTESIVIPGANIWDIAAGVIIVREAGGRVTDFQGADWNIDSADMAASNGRVHREILKVLRTI